MSRPSDGALGAVRQGHNEWYKREVDRGRRFHGAFEGGQSAGYHGTVGSAEGWRPTTFASSRTKRQRLDERTAADYADDDDGLLGASLQVSRHYEARREDDDDDDDPLRRLTRDLDTRSRRMLRLLSRRHKSSHGVHIEETKMPTIPTKTTRFCVGYEGAVARPPRPGRRDEGTTEGQYRVADLLGGGGDDDEDVYDSGGRKRFALTVLPEKDEDSDSDDDGRREEGGLFRLPATDRAALLLEGRRETRILSQGEALPGFRRAIEEDSLAQYDLAEPPRDWRGVHRFVDEPPPATTWTRRRPFGGRDALPPKPPAKPKRKVPAALSERFAPATNAGTTSSKDSKLWARGGLHMPQDVFTPSAEKEPEKRDPPTWAVKPTRSSMPWRPEALLCKRFALPVPAAVTAPPSPLPTQQQQRRLPARDEALTESALEPPRPPERPSLDVMKKIFDAVDQGRREPPPPEDKEDTHQKKEEEPPPLPTSSGAFFDDLFRGAGDVLPSSMHQPPPPEQQPPPLEPKRKSHDDDDDLDDDLSRKKKTKKKHKKSSEGGDKKKKKKKKQHHHKKKSSSSSRRRRDATSSDSEED